MRLLLTVLACLWLAASPATAGVLDHVRETGALRLGYRTDAVPFSFKDVGGAPAGYSVELCKAVAREVERVKGGSALSVDWVVVTSENRFAALQEGRVDLLCEATTETLSRRQQMDFSLLTFATGVSLIYRVDGPSSFQALNGQKVGVRAGTTAQAALSQSLQKVGINAQVVPVDDHAAGLERVAKGEFAAYFADAAILIYQLLKSPSKDKLRVSDQLLTFEPYALAMPHGDDDFRLLVDRTLAQIYRTKDINRFFEASFGGPIPADLLRALFILQAIPE